MLCETIDAGLLRRAAEAKDDENILIHIRGKDCVAIEVRYHKVCYTNYTKFLTREQKYNEHVYLNISYEESFAEFCKEVIEKKLIAKKTICYMSQLFKMFLQIVKRTKNVDTESFRAFRLKEKSMNKYPQLVFHTPKVPNVSEMAYVEDLSAGDVMNEYGLPQHFQGDDFIEIDDNMEDAPDDQIQPDVNEKQILFHAANILRGKLEDSSILNVPWPPVASDLTIDNAKKVVPVELFNTLAWICGFSDEPILEKFVTLKEGKFTKVLSIAQDLVFVSSNGRKHTPKSLSLGMAIRQLTGSSHAIRLLNNLGHCMSHSFVLMHETALAQSSISESMILPLGFKKHLSTVIAWDNDDFLEETRTRSGSTHVVGGIIIQNDEITDEGAREQQRDLGLKRLKSLPLEEIPIKPYVLGKKESINLSSEASNIDVGDKSFLEVQITPKKLDLAHIMCRMPHFGCNESIPNWTCFNTLLNSISIPPLSKIGYLPIIDAPATDIKTIKEILDRSTSIADKLSLKYMCLVFDEAIYAKIQTVRWKNESYLSRFIIRLGDYHMAMSFLGAIGKLFKDSGLEVKFCHFPYLVFLGTICYLEDNNFTIFTFISQC